MKTQDPEEPERLCEDLWQQLDLKSRICLKSLEHSMAHRFTDDDGELTPLGDGVVWWLMEVWPEADYDAMVHYLETSASKLIESLAEQADKKETAHYEAQKLIVVRTAQDRLLRGDDVDEDRQEDEAQQEPEDPGSAG